MVWRLTLHMLCAVTIAFGINVAHAESPKNLDLSTERIVNYETEIWVQGDETLLITETITVVRTGERIRRGIFKSIPIHPRVSPPRYEVIEVLRNGQAEDFFFGDPSKGQGNRLYTGRADKFLEDGLHEY